MCFILFANRFLNKVLNGIKTFYPGFILFANRFLNVVIVFYSVEKRFYSVENLVQKLVREQDKTHEFSPYDRLRFAKLSENPTYVHLPFSLCYPSISYWTFSMEKLFLHIPIEGRIYKN